MDMRGNRVSVVRYVALGIVVLDKPFLCRFSLLFPNYNVKRKVESLPTGSAYPLGEFFMSQTDALWQVFRFTKVDGTMRQRFPPIIWDCDRVKTTKRAQVCRPLLQTEQIWTREHQAAKPN